MVLTSCDQSNIADARQLCSRKCSTLRARHHCRVLPLLDREVLAVDAEGVEAHRLEDVSP